MVSVLSVATTPPNAHVTARRPGRCAVTDLLAQLDHRCLAWPKNCWAESRCYVFIDAQSGRAPRSATQVNQRVRRLLRFRDRRRFVGKALGDGPNLLGAER